jgi:hypothetical protein
MSYTTVDRFLNTYPRMGASTTNSAGVYAWLTRAFNHINSNLADAVPTIPVTPTCPLLMDLEEDLAFAMYLRRNVREAKDLGIQDMWKDVQERLDGIRNGTVILLDSNGGEISTTRRNDAPWSSLSGYQPTFGMGEIEDAEVDTCRVTAEEDAK